jgi:D-alanine-D-alanine ligase-like ATP-grasp enzyme
MERFDNPGEVRERKPILRLSDPVMFAATEMLTTARVTYVGPSFEAMTRCYDKFAASRAIGTSPETALGNNADAIAFPVVVKPRSGSDSLGVLRHTRGPIPEHQRTDRYVVQRYVRGTEITVAILNAQAGEPLHIQLSDGALYTFGRKYLLRPRVVPLADQQLAERVRAEAIGIARSLGVNWAARIDLIHEPSSDQLYFLECDVAPLVGLGSAFERSLSAARIERSAQLEQLFLS